MLSIPQPSPRSTSICRIRFGLLVLLLPVAPCAAQQAAPPQRPPQAQPIQPRNDDDAPDATPAPEVPLEVALKPFENLPGSWTGVGIPAANRLRGWNEAHVWSFVFVNGEPAALNVSLTGNKNLKEARLSYQEQSGQLLYRLEGKDLQGTKVEFTGRFEEGAETPTLNLERIVPLPGNIRQRIVFRIIGSGESYTWWDERQGPGGNRFTREVEIRQGRVVPKNANAGGGRAKCIISGGEAALTVAYNGRSYPVCCTGCREEFLADPERWLAKLAKRQQTEAATGSAPAPGGEPMPEPAGDDAPSAEPAPDDKPAPEADDTPAETAKPAPKAKTKAKSEAEQATDLLKRAQAFEKEGKNSAALIYYQRLTSEFPGTPQATTARDRLKALRAK